MSDFFDSDSDSSTSTVFRDIIFLALAGFVTIVILILPHINPPKNQDNQDIPPPGNMMVEIFWDDKADVDVDLWVKAPKDKVVGYSTSSGMLFDLLRDDMGHTTDGDDRNYEIALTRGVLSGQYIINVMLYNSKLSAISPIKVTVIVSMKKNRKAKMARLLMKKIILYRDKDEITVFSFKLDYNMDMIKESISEIYIPLAIPNSNRYGDYE